MILAQQCHNNRNALYLFIIIYLLNNQRPAFCDTNALIEKSFCLLDDYWSEGKLQLSISTMKKNLKLKFNLIQFIELIINEENLL